MFWDQKTLFDDLFFEQALGLKAPRPFTVRYFISDTRNIEEPEISCFTGIKGERFDGSDYAGQAYECGVRVFLLGKQVPLPGDALVFIVPDVVQALGKLAHCHKMRLMIPHVLITGSVGKTTTRMLCAAVLGQKYPVHTAKKNFNNEIGLPLTILETPSEARASVLEAGMNSKGEIARLSRIVCPEIAIITNVHLIHAGPLGGLEGVAEAKSEITEGMNETSILLISESEPFKEMFAGKVRGHLKVFRPSAVKVLRDQGEKGFVFWYEDYPGEEFYCPLPGVHLTLNLSVVFALAEIFNVPASLIREGLASCEPLPERMDFFRRDGALVIADCYNASLPSFKAALDVLKNSPRPRTAVMGDMLELDAFAEGVHTELMQYLISEGCADRIFVHGPEMIRAAEKFREKIPCRAFPEWGQLPAALDALYKEGGSVLLKASHGMKFGALAEKNNP